MGKRISEHEDLSRWGIVEDTKKDPDGPKAISFIFPYFENPEMLKLQLENINNFEAKTKARLEVLICDDCSNQHPIKIDKIPEGLLSFKVFKVLEKKKWGWPICRNICAVNATTDWLLMTDIDHLAPEETIKALMSQKQSPDRAYKLTRRLVDGSNYSIHANSYFLSKNLMKKVKYYTEDFLGLYGTDGMFRDRLKKGTDGNIYILKHPLVMYGRDDVPDASTTMFRRKSEADGKAIQEIRDMMATTPDYVPKFLSLPYEQVI